MPSPEDRLIQQHTLKLDRLSVPVHLGCTSGEQALAQEVQVSVEFRFHRAPGGVTSDRLDQTICYAQVSQAIQQTAQAKAFHLIEKLAAEIFMAVREIAGDQAAVGLRVHKVRPPVEGLLGGSHYSCGDFII